MSPNFLALGAIGLWSTLAWLGVRLATMPPFLLVGSALTLAGIAAAPTWRAWRVRPRVLALGVYGLFGFHFLLFVALRLAPPLQANVVNYLWPLLIVLLAPAFLRDARASRRQFAGGVLGLAGAALAIVGDRSPAALFAPDAAAPAAAWGYGAALASAFVWATYSLLGRRLRERGMSFPTAAVGAFCLVSGLLALGCHAVFEARYAWRAADALPLAALAIGPMGLAFFLWDAALARGDAATIGTLAYLTPVLSTALLAVSRPAGDGAAGWPIGVALLLVLAGAALGSATTRGRPTDRGRRHR